MPFAIRLIYIPLRMMPLGSSVEMLVQFDLSRLKNISIDEVPATKINLSIKYQLNVEVKEEGE